VGLCALGLFLLGPMSLAIGIALQSEILIFGIFGFVGLSFLTGLIAIGLATFARLRGPWAVVGLVTGVTSVLFSLFGGVGTLFLI
jgi:hypothetical protein